MSAQGEALNERARHLLKVLIDGYIQDGQPIGSTALAKRSGLKLSPATIRNVMHSLEEAGYIESPHTSAGRIPTSLGYRFFVDSLVKVEPLEDREQNTIADKFQPDLPAEIIKSASSLLSGMTQLAGVISTPKTDNLRIRQMEFLPLSPEQALVVLVMSNNDVQNRIIALDKPFTPSELQQMSNYLNQLLSGKDIQQARSTLLGEMKQVKTDMNALMMAAIAIGEQTVTGLDNKRDDACIIAGRSNLLEYDELSDTVKLKQLFEAFNQKRDVLNLLDKCMQAEGVQIFIGSESGHDVFDDCSVVTAPYTIDEDHVGVLGVIGPKRMRYDRVIPVVDITAKLVGAALQSDSTR